MAAERGSRASVIVIDVGGHRVELARDDVVQLRDAAAALAGSSTRARDLSLVLSRALSSELPVALRRSEARTAIRIAANVGLDELAARLRPG